MSALSGLGPALAPRPESGTASLPGAAPEEAAAAEASGLEAIFAALLQAVEDAPARSLEGSPDAAEGATAPGRFGHGEEPAAPGLWPGREAASPAGGSPRHAAPSHAAPGHAAPGHAAPGHGAPGHGAPGHGAPGAATGAAAVSAAGPGVTLTLSGELVEGAPALAAGTEGSASELAPGAEDGAEDVASGNAVDPAPSPRELDAPRLAAAAGGEQRASDDAELARAAAQVAKDATKPAPDDARTDAPGPEGTPVSAQSGGEGEAAAAPAPTAGTPPGGASRLLGRLADTPQNTRADVRVLSQRPGESLVEVEHPELGRVRLRVATGAGGVDVRAVAESLGAAWALRRSEDELRPRIARLGAELRRFDVRTGALAQLRPGKEPGPALPRTTPLARPGARLHRKA